MSRPAALKGHSTRHRTEPDKNRPDRTRNRTETGQDPDSTALKTDVSDRADAGPGGGKQRWAKFAAVIK